MVLVFIFCAFLILIIASAFQKGMYHFEYLKLNDKSKFKNSLDFFSSFSMLSWDFSRQILIFPFLKRIHSAEDTVAEKYYRKTKFYLILNIASIISLIAFIFILVKFFT
jgi:hypothetical protein